MRTKQGWRSKWRDGWSRRGGWRARGRAEMVARSGGVKKKKKKKWKSNQMKERLREWKTELV